MLMSATDATQGDASALLEARDKMGAIRLVRDQLGASVAGTKGIVERLGQALMCRCVRGRQTYSGGGIAHRSDDTDTRLDGA